MIIVVIACLPLSKSRSVHLCVTTTMHPIQFQEGISRSVDALSPAARSSALVLAMLPSCRCLANRTASVLIKGLLFDKFPSAYEERHAA